MPATYLWLRQLLAQLLPELEDLPTGPQGAAQAQAWFQRLLTRFVERGLQTPAQQKNRVVDARNAIRARFGADHPALAHVGFDESTWQAINLPTHDRTEARNENQRLLRHPERIVARAAQLLASPRFEDLAVGLGLCVGRRISELLDAHARLEPATPWSVFFTGQRKHRGEREDFAFEIPTLAPALDVLAAWARLQVMLGDQGLDPQEINNRYGHEVNQAADRHFRGLVPPRLPRPPKGKAGSLADPHARQRPGDALYLHLFRAVYATIAVHWFCPPRVNRLVYKAEIQGHRQILEAQGTLRRAYTASRHYDDYQIADESGENLDGRQGIKLGRLEGLEVLRVFQSPPPPPETTPPPSIAPEEGTNEPASLSPEPATPPPPPSPMDPAAPAAPIPDSSPVTPTDAAPDGGPAPAAPLAKPAKKPRPVTYRLYPADRPRLDAFRADPKQSQADNLQGVIDLLENASAAIQAQEQSQAQLQQAQAHAAAAEEQLAQALREREEGRQEAQGLSQEAQSLRERLAAQEQEVQRLLAALAQERARVAATTTGAAGGAAPLAQAVLARELLNLAMGGECQGELQTRLISLATQALGGGGTGGPTHPEKRQDTTAGQPGAAKGGGPRKATKVPVDQGRFGPLFAAQGAGDGQAQTHVAPTATPEQPQAATPTQESAAAQELAAVSDQAAREPVDKLPPSSEVPADDAQEPPGASQTPLAPSTLPPPPKRRGGAAEKLEKALAAVIAHNEAQGSREAKWAVTESALARLTGCFRPAVRAFFAQRAEEIEAHNHKHHLLPGLNAARGRRDQQIEHEVRWREEAAEGGTAVSEETGEAVGEEG